MRQVITIGTGGGISGLQVKPGKGMDLRQFGKAVIKRASEILWHERRQKWYVKVLEGTYAGRFVNCADLRKAGYAIDGPGWEVAYFDDYDEAVRAEIAFLNHVRQTEGSAAL